MATIGSASTPRHRASSPHTEALPARQCAGAAASRRCSGGLRRARRAVALWVAVMALAAPLRESHARVVRPVLSGSLGFGFEVHPDAAPQAENMMLTFGLGFLGDLIRPELGLLTAYGKLWGKGRQTFQYELRPMLRLGLPFIPLYGRLIFAGLSVFEDRRNIAYGGALGLNFNAGPLAIFGEFGPLPRRVSSKTHWVLEARAGVAYRF